MIGSTYLVIACHYSVYYPTLILYVFFVLLRINCLSTDADVGFSTWPASGTTLMSLGSE